MRTQRNPNYRQPSTHEIKPVVFLVVTNLPENDPTGYHKDRFEVIKTCLTTMRERAYCEHTFFIWDNGSGKLLRTWLQNEFKPDILVQSPNYGKGISRAYAVHMLPKDTIVCYSDDDFYYFENWLNPHLELLRSFPNVSVVSGYPIRTQFQRGIDNTLDWAMENAKIEKGLFIPEEWELEHAASVGCGWGKYQRITSGTQDYKITYNGVQAYGTSHHCQFVGIAGKIADTLDAAIDGLAMPDEWPLDIALDEAGLRLCTIQRQCRHIGNVLDESFDV